MQKLRVGVFVGAIGVAAVAAHGAFLDDLAADERKVESSPFASGGDVILKVNDREYIHIFTSTEAEGSFMPSHDLKAWVLAVGGGGGARASNGQRPGGGGGGGFVESFGVAFPAGSYTVTVGAGGERYNNGTGAAGSGGSSSINGLTARGGGGGGCGSAGADGASGGGGSGGTIYNGGQATDDGAQGFAGMSGTAICGGGGGGAGGLAAMVTSLEPNDPKMQPSHGGPGRSSQILGFEQFFGGGGGGARANNYRVSFGGLGGGGNGGADSSADRSDVFHGENGLGGGGGGVFQPSNSGNGGSGGSGIVIVRYAVPLAGEPLLGPCEVRNQSGSSLAFKGLVVNSGASAATVKIKLWPVGASENEAEIQDMATVAAGTVYASFDTLVTGLAFGTTYNYAYWLENANDATAAVTGTIATYSSTLTPVAKLADNSTVVPVRVGIEDVYTFTSAGTFTVPEGQRALVKLLVVGGGGAGGGWGGAGGGGGSVKYYPAYLLEAGQYEVTVGAGGVHSTQNGGGATTEQQHGGPSGFGEIVALGGGAAGNPFRAANNAGSGQETGGCSSGMNPMGTYSPVAADGFAGGNSKRVSGGGNSSVGYSGGGGGAGGAGTDATVEAGGDGGAGYACAITGTTGYYGAGGGGAQFYTITGVGGIGGSGVGGNAGDVNGEDLAARSGTAGTFYGAGGGGGAINTANQHGYGGDGYQGVVVVAVADYSLASGAPILEVGDFTDVAIDSAVANVNVSFAGSGATVRLTAQLGYSEDDFSLATVELSDALIGEGVFTLDGLMPSRTYYVKFVADNGTGGADAVSEVVKVLTTASNLDPNPGAVTHTQAAYTFRFSPTTALGDGTNTALLFVAESSAALDSAEPVATQPVETFTDNQAISYLLNLQTALWQFGMTYFYRIALVNVYGDGRFASTNWTSVSSFVLTDNAVYWWKGGDARWDDSASWTCSVADSFADGKSLGYPVYGATARFPDEICTTVRVFKAEVCEEGMVDFSCANGYYYFLGETADAKCHGAKDCSWGANSTFVFDGVETFTPIHSGARAIPAGTRVTIRNGGRYTARRYPNSDWNGFDMLSGDGSELTAESGAVINVGGLTMANGSWLTVDGGSVTANDFGFYGITCDLAAVADAPGGAVTIGAEGSRLSLSRLVATHAPVTVTFTVPETAYTTAVPLAVGNAVRVAESGETITFAVAGKSPVRAARKGDTTLVSAAGGVNTANVAFGTTATANDYFYFTDAAGEHYRTASAVPEGVTITGIGYHHEPNAAMVIVIR